MATFTDSSVYLIIYRFCVSLKWLLRRILSQVNQFDATIFCRFSIIYPLHMVIVLISWKCWKLYLRILTHCMRKRFIPTQIFIFLRLLCNHLVKNIVFGDFNANMFGFVMKGVQQFPYFLEDLGVKS